MNVLLDMDGVLCNFVKGCCRLFGLDEQKTLSKWAPNEYRVDSVFGITEEQLWEKINDEKDRFWATLDEYEWSRKLYEECQKFGNVYFLTAPSTLSASLAGKAEWMQKFTGNSKFRDYLVGSPKFLCAKEDNVLIDDSDKNCDSFRDAGGRTVLFPQPWNTLHGYKGSKIEHVISEMNKLKT